MFKILCNSKILCSLQADEHKKIDFQVQNGVNIDMSAAGLDLASVAAIRLVVLHA